MHIHTSISLPKPNPNLVADFMFSLHNLTNQKSMWYWYIGYIHSSFIVVLVAHWLYGGRVQRHWLWRRILSIHLSPPSFISIPPPTHINTLSRIFLISNPIRSRWFFLLRWHKWWWRWLSCRIQKIRSWFRLLWYLLSRCLLLGSLTTFFHNLWACIRSWCITYEYEWEVLSDTEWIMR